MQNLTETVAHLLMKETVTKEQKNFAIDAIVSMVVDDLSTQFHEDSDKVLTDFICSNTGKLLLSCCVLLFTILPYSNVFGYKL